MFKKILFSLSGLDKQVLNTCNPATTTLYVVVSLTMMVLFIFAVILMSFAASTFTSSLIIISAVSILWGILIFCANLFILNSPLNFKTFLVRFVVAGIFAFILSIFAEIFLSNQEINYTHLKNESLRKEDLINNNLSQRNLFSKQIDSLDNKLSTLHSTLNSLFSQQEIERKKSLVPFYIETKSGLELRYKFIPTARLLLIREQIPEIKSSISELTERNKLEVNRIQEDVKTTEEIYKQKLNLDAPFTFPSRYIIYEEIKSDNKHFNEIAWGVKVFFFTIELLVLFFKLLLYNNEYELKIKLQRLESEADFAEKKYELLERMSDKEVRNSIRSNIKNDLIKPLFQKFKRNGKNHSDISTNKKKEI